MIKAFDEFYDNVFNEVPKSVIEGLVNKIYSYLEDEDVFINVYDVTFDNTVYNDIRDYIFNFLNHNEDFDILTNFNTSSHQKRNVKRDKLMELKEALNLEYYIPIMDTLHHKYSLNGLYAFHGGRKPFDSEVILSSLILMAITGESYENLASNLVNDESYACFIGYPIPTPKKSTIANYLQLCSERNYSDDLWNAHLDFLNDNMIKFGKAVLQDASFISQNPGHQKPSKPRGEKAKTSRSVDGEWTVKYKTSFFGLKIHIKMDLNTQMIMSFYLTGSKTHDINIDLCEKFEIDYKDTGYAKKEKDEINAIMSKAYREQPIPPVEIDRNNRISAKRRLCERIFAVLHHYHIKHTTKTTKNEIKFLLSLTFMVHNINQLINQEKDKKDKTRTDKRKNDKKKKKDEKDEKIHLLNSKGLQNLFNQKIKYKYYNKEDIDEKLGKKIEILNKENETLNNEIKISEKKIKDLLKEKKILTKNKKNKKENKEDIRLIKEKIKNTKNKIKEYKTYIHENKDQIKANKINKNLNNHYIIFIEKINDKNSEITYKKSMKRKNQVSNTKKNNKKKLLNKKNIAALKNIITPQNNENDNIQIIYHILDYNHPNNIEKNNTKISKTQYKKNRKKAKKKQFKKLNKQKKEIGIKIDNQYNFLKLTLMEKNFNSIEMSI
ncbi:MAG: transposase [Methanobrevibacter sp.]|nr:transposase [Candidatus Methanoflexus mossambicus]